MTEPVHKVRKGEPFVPSVAFQHATVDAIEFVRRLQQTEGAATARCAPGAGVVLVYNASGSDCDQYDILGIASPAPGWNYSALSADSRIVLWGLTPSGLYEPGQFVVLLEPIASQHTGRALIDGVTWARIKHPDYMVTGKVNSCARPIPGDKTRLETCYEGPATILWQTFDPYTRLGHALVRLGERNRFRLFELKTDLAGDHADAYRRVSDGNQWIRDSSTIFLVYDVCGAFAGAKGADSNPPAGHGSYGIAYALLGTNTWHILILNPVP